jgi:hypothetical protein
MLILGIDPGVTGAFAWMEPDGRLIDVDDMPVRAMVGSGRLKNEADPTAMRKLLNRRIPADRTALAIMEHMPVSPMGKQGVQTQMSLVATKQVVRTVCELLRIDVAFITPQVWQKAYGIKTRADSDTKQQSLKLARELYGRDHCPLQKHHGRADAILIARYAQKNLV